jgi:hypothetical protein
MEIPPPQYPSFPFIPLIPKQVVRNFTATIARGKAAGSRGVSVFNPVLVPVSFLW